MNVSYKHFSDLGRKLAPMWYLAEFCVKTLLPFEIYYSNELSLRDLLFCFERTSTTLRNGVT